MARLSKTERDQFQRVSREQPQPRRWVPCSPAGYLAFASFAARFSPVAKPKLMTDGKHWKL